MGRDPVFMVAYLFSILVGTALGFLAGLGVGGGSLLILWLTGVLGMAHEEARTINLLFFLPSALVASIFRWCNGAIDIRRILPAVMAGSAAAAAGSWLSTHIDPGLVQKLFGVLLLITGLRELLYRPRKAR